MYIILKFLLASIFRHYDYLCETLNLENCLHTITCLMETPTSLLHALVYKCPWVKKNMLSLIGIPPHIYLISKIDILLNNQSVIVERVVDTFKLDLDEKNIEGG